MLEALIEHTFVGQENTVRHTDRSIDERRRSHMDFFVEHVPQRMHLHAAGTGHGLGAIRLPHLSHFVHAQALPRFFALGDSRTFYLNGRSPVLSRSVGSGRLDVSDGLDIRTYVRDKNKVAVFLIHVNGIQTTGHRNEVDRRLVPFLYVAGRISVG